MRKWNDDNKRLFFGKLQRLLVLWLNQITTSTKIREYKFLINKRESTGLKHFNDPKAFSEYSNDMPDVYKNIDEYNTDKERKMLIVFDMITDMINNKKLNSIVTELFIRGRKLNNSLVFIAQSYFKVPKMLD